MLKILEDLITSNDTSAWLTAVGVAVGLFLVLSLLKRLVVRGLSATGAKTRSDIHQLSSAVLAKTGRLFFFLVSLFTGAHFLTLGPEATRVLDVILGIGVVFQLGLWGSAAVNFWLTVLRQKRQGDAGSTATLGILGLALRVALWSIVLLLGLDNLGVDVTGLVAGLGISGIAIALAVQNILGDLLSSISIIMDKPFEVGDFVVVDQYLGSVEYIGLKTTRVRSLSGEQIIFSNSDLLQSRIRNYKRMSERRIVFTIVVKHDTPSETVEAIPGMLREAVEGRADTRFDRAHFKEFGESGLVFECVYYVLSPDYNRSMDLQQQINLTILRRLKKNNIVLAYPTRTIHVNTTPEPGAIATRRGARRLP